MNDLTSWLMIVLAIVIITAFYGSGDSSDAEYKQFKNKTK